MSTFTQTCLKCAVAVALAACASNGTTDDPVAGPGGTTGKTQGTSGTSGGGTSGGGSGGGSGGSGSGGSVGSGDDVGGGGDDGGGGGGTGEGGTAAGDDGGTTGSSAGDGGGTGGGTPGAGNTCFPAGSGTDFTSDGPLMATSADNTTVSCTILQPTVLGSGGCLNPVIIWGNGTFNTPSNYTALFNHFATHGFIVAAADTSNSGSGMEMLACLNYILAQNTSSGSPFNGHIDTNHIASSGYSQGGAGCLAAGEDKRFTTVLAVSPYVVISLGSYDPSTYAAAQIHPLFMISGSADTVAPANNNQQPIFMTAPVPIFWGTHAGSTHFEVLSNGGAYAGPMTAWFRWKLIGDPNAEQWFEKPCDLCTASGWTVQTNSMWQ